MEKVISNKFGPSSLRTYHALSSVDQQVFDELRKIGKVLGAHGFTNITCIEAFDGSGRYYIEVDMRPNVWVDAPIFLGEDVAERILRWYSKRECLNYPVPTSAIYPSKMQIPYFLRLNFFELLINRYHVWRFIPKDNWPLISMLFFNKIKEFLSQYTLKNLFKRLTLKKYHPQFKKNLL